MNKIYILHHSYTLDSHDETKLIGTYSSEEEAKSAIERLKDKPGFRDRIESFEISEYELNKDNWTGGYSTITSIQVKNINNEWITTTAECLIDGTYQIIEYYENDKLGEFKNLDIVKGEFINDELFAVELIKKSE